MDQASRTRRSQECQLEKPACKVDRLLKDGEKVDRRLGNRQENDQHAHGDRIVRRINSQESIHGKVFMPRAVKPYFSFKIKVIRYPLRQ